jgi:hypothetical protein
VITVTQEIQKNLNKTPLDNEYLEKFLKKLRKRNFDERNKDNEYLGKLVAELPKEDFDEIHFVEEVVRTAQDVRKFEQNQKEKDPQKKIIRPDHQKALVTRTLKEQANKLYEILKELPDDCAMRVDHQYLSADHDNHKFVCLPTVGFTDLAREITKQLMECCRNSYKQGNQGWRNLYKTQESRIALAWKQSGPEITTTIDSDFFNALCNFRTYCQVPGYNEDQVSPVEIQRIKNQLS